MSDDTKPAPMSAEKWIEPVLLSIFRQCTDVVGEDVSHDVLKARIILTKAIETRLAAVEQRIEGLELALSSAHADAAVQRGIAEAAEQREAKLRAELILAQNKNERLLQSMAYISKALTLQSQN
jgi:hypothetical protein